MYSYPMLYLEKARQLSQLGTKLYV